MTSVKRSILATLSYHDIFDYPMTVDEIHKYQISNIKYQKHISKIKKILEDLVKKKKISYRNDYYFLPGRGEIVEVRKKRRKCSQKKLKLAKKTIKILSKVPFVKTIAITGALAMKNSDKDDDIDFLIITAKNRLWLTRLIAVFILEVLGKRRRPKDKKIKDKVCLNMFLDEFTLSLPKEKRNLFTAHEIVQIKPLYNKQQTYEKFLKVNQWIRQHLPDGIKSQKSKVKSQKYNSKFKNKKSWILDTGYWILDFLERFAYQFQLKYMKGRKTTEQISPHLAFFHPKDTGKEILEEYKKRLNSIL